MKLIVQGDVYLKEVSAIPSGAKKVNRDKEGYVLARGEHTGNLHVIEDDLNVYEKDGIWYIKTANKPVVLKHTGTETHQPVILEPHKIYERGIQLEVDPFDLEVRNVQD